MGVNLDDVFRQVARAQPGAPAVLGPGPGDALTYGALDALVGQFARSFESAGVKSGTCVGVHAPNGAAYIAATYAAWRCGACAA
jgi:acyl-CoA synthetase (AMP-forming)/AMP-acid ligase II